MTLGRRRLLAAFVLASTLALVGTARADQEVSVADGYAIAGYDPVAYFLKGEAVQGSDAYTLEHEGARYRFVSAEHRDLFAAEPARFAPAYGGFCAFGTAMGRKFDGDPEAWTVVDGRLFLTFDRKVRHRWRADSAGYIRGADHNWPIIAHLSDRELDANPPAGLTLGPQ